MSTKLEEGRVYTSGYGDRLTYIGYCPDLLVSCFIDSFSDSVLSERKPYIRKILGFSPIVAKTFKLIN